MTSEQLQNARAERWRQLSNPILTAEDAQAWMDGVGFCLFLPPRAHFSAPAPSFVEAVLGASADAPAREAVENASSLLQRLIADGAVAPLNLFGQAAFGNGGAGATDQPDFLVSRAALPYVFSLIGGRNWKSGPGTKASPLVLEIWKQLDGAGAQTAPEIQSALGRELTEAAVLRGLLELWHGLRAIPVYEGETARWELTQARFAAEMTASQKVAQPTALSALVSLYLESAVAASSEEIETFLSPLTSRSRVREVVNGLSATRQLGLVSIAAQPLLHVAGSLPEFEEEEPAKPEARPEFERRVPFEKRGSFQREREVRPHDRGERGPRPERTGFGRSGAGRFAARGEGASGTKGERPYRKPDDRRPADRERKPFGKKPFERTARPAGSRPSDRERPSGSGGKFPPKRFGSGGAKPWQQRGERAAGSEERPFRPRREEGHDGERRSSGFGGAEKSGEKRFGGPKKFGEKRFGGPKKFSGSKFGGPKKFGGSKFGPKKFGDPKFDSRSGGEKRPFLRERGGKDEESRGSGARPRSSEGGKPAVRRGEWKPRPAGGGFQKSGGREVGKSGKPGFKGGEKSGFKTGARPGFQREGGSGFKRAGFGKTAKPFGKSSGAGSNSGKPFGKSGNPFEKSGRPFGKSPRPSGRAGGPASRGSKPGGFKPPFRKRKREGEGSGE